MKGFIEICYREGARDVGQMLINVNHIVTIREASDGDGTYISTSDDCWVSTNWPISQVIDELKEALK